jgi:hypothetical protein
MRRVRVTIAAAVCALTACSATPPRPSADASAQNPAVPLAPTSEAVKAAPGETFGPGPEREAPGETPEPQPAPEREAPGETPEPKPAPGENPESERPAKPDEPPAEENVLETTRRYTRSTTEWLARGVDSWFGDQPFYASGGGVRDGRLTIAMLKQQDEGFQGRVRFNARIRLPNAERQAYFFVGRDNDREVVSDTPGALTRSQRLQTETPQEQSFFTGLGFSLVDAVDLRLGFHGIKPYAQARYRQPWKPTEIDLFEFRQTFFWDTSDRLGSTTAFSYEHGFSSTLALRWLTGMTITQKTDSFDWSSTLGTYKTYGEERTSALEFVVSGRLDTGIAFGEYGLQTKWQQRLYREWLLGEFLVGYYWPRPDRAFERARRWALGFTATMKF